MATSTRMGATTASDEGRKARRKARLLAVVSATVAALIVWVVAELAVGIDLRTPAFGSWSSFDVNAAVVIVTAAAAGLLAWGLLALLERMTARARAVWTAIAVVVFVLSLGQPMSGSGITSANRLWLALMHVAVAVVLVPLLGRTASNRARQPVQA